MIVNKKNQMCAISVSYEYDNYSAWGHLRKSVLKLALKKHIVNITKKLNVCYGKYLLVMNMTTTLHGVAYVSLWCMGRQ